MATVGDIFTCGKSTSGVIETPKDEFRARNATGIFGGYDNAVVLEHGKIQWLSTSKTFAPFFKVNNPAPSNTERTKDDPTSNSEGPESSTKSLEIDLPINNVKSVSFGKEHFLVLDENGQVYSWGKGNEGQLGIGVKGLGIKELFAYANVLHPVESLKGHVVSSISCGDYHSAAMTSIGEIFTWGSGVHAATGHASKHLSQDQNHRSADVSIYPKLIPFTMKNRCVSLSCGSNFTCVVTNKGEIYGWGDGTCGQLGQVGRKTKQEYPALVYKSSPLNGNPFTEVSCGFGHTLALTADGHVYSFGLNNCGQLGNGDDNKHLQDSPILVSFPVVLEDSNTINNNSDTDDKEQNQSTVIKKIQACGLSSSALSEAGKAFTWGYGGDGRLFHRPLEDKDPVEQQLIKDLKHKLHHHEFNPFHIKNILDGGIHEYKPKYVDTFGGQVVADFVMTGGNSYAFTPATIKSLNIEYDPIEGGTDICLYGLGFFDSPRTLVRFQPKATNSIGRCLAGKFVKDNRTGECYITAKTPKFSRGGTVVVEVSLNGKDFTEDGISYQTYIQPSFSLVKPRFSRVTGGTTIQIVGEGIFLSNSCRVKFKVGHPVEIVNAETIEMHDEQINEEDPIPVNISCITPALDTAEEKPFAPEVSVAMNGVSFVPVIYDNLTSEEELIEKEKNPGKIFSRPFLMHDVVINQLSPNLFPAEGGQILTIYGNSFYPELFALITIFYQDEEGNKKSKSFGLKNEIPVIYKSPDVLNVKMPPTNYVLGQADKHFDIYEANICLLSDKEVVSQALKFHYYREGTFQLTSNVASLQGNGVIFLKSENRLMPSATDVTVRVLNEEFGLDQIIQGEYLTPEQLMDPTLNERKQASDQNDIEEDEQSVDDEEEEVDQAAEDQDENDELKEEGENVSVIQTAAIKITLPGLENVPPKPEPMESEEIPVEDGDEQALSGPVNPYPIPVKLSVAYNGQDYSDQTLTYYYYSDPKFLDLNVDSGIPGDEIIVTGEDIFPSNNIKVRFQYSKKIFDDFNAEFLPAVEDTEGGKEIDITSGITGSIRFICPEFTKKKTRPLSTSILVAMDGSNYLPLPDPVKFTFQDPNKAAAAGKKKK